MREKAKRNRRSERDYHEKDLEGKKENIVSHSKKRILLPSYFVCPLLHFGMSQNIVMFLKIKVINLLIFLLYLY